MEIVFDLDGTLARTDDALPPDFDHAAPDWPAFYRAIPRAEPIAPMIELLRSLLRDPHNRIEIWTARDEGATAENRDATLRWLSRQEIFVAGPRAREHVDRERKSFDFYVPGRIVLALRMRVHGDERPSEVIKAEWLSAARAEGRAVDLVFEDREPLARMFRAAGVAVCQVAPRDGPDPWAGT